MSTFPDAPRDKTEPTRGMKNGCLAILFWGILLAVLVGVISYLLMTWFADEVIQP